MELRSALCNYQRDEQQLFFIVKLRSRQYLLLNIYLGTAVVFTGIIILHRNWLI